MASQSAVESQICHPQMGPVCCLPLMVVLSRLCCRAGEVAEQRMGNARIGTGRVKIMVLVSVPGQAGSQDVAGA